MTTTLLIIIAVLLAVRIVLQIRQGKRAFEKMYQATSEVEGCVKVVKSDDRDEMARELGKASKNGWELVSTHQPNMVDLYLFFTRKKIKNYYEE